jgi:tetratricopeptide (TPR) repeat protein
LNNLAYPLLLQGHYEEALHCLQGAILIHPEATNPYASLADVYLYQGIEPERALELMECAMERQKKSRQGVQGIHWATRAWALALLGQHDEAAESLRRASQSINPQVKPLFAELEYISGEVNRLAGRPGEARVYFNAVLTIDSQGMWRDRAERALHSMSAETVGEPAHA